TPSCKPCGNPPYHRASFYLLLLPLRVAGLLQSCFVPGPGFMRPYTVVSAPARFCHEQKRSTFTALLYPVQTREQALDRVAEVRRQMPGARHYCWAYVLGPAHQPRAQAFSDDGEPGGTAGKPM